MEQNLDSEQIASATQGISWSRGSVVIRLLLEDLPTVVSASCGEARSSRFAGGRR